MDFSTKNAEISFSPVKHITRYKSLTDPPVIKHFDPFIIKSSLSFLAIVFIEIASLPELGSVKQYEAN